MDDQLFSMLKDLRKQISKKMNLPPFVIFQDPSLEAMCTYYPITIQELQNMPGVGTGKANRFGKEFVTLIARHVEENDIDRPMDLVVKSVANKSKNKIAIIQAIDRQMPLDDIASSKGLEMSELIKELESIVYSGTRVNIDYYIDQVMDEDNRDDIFEYFKEEAETDDIDAALEELGEEQYSTRITSYNVCYTKLLRAHSLIKTAVAVYCAVGLSVVGGCELIGWNGMK